MSQAKPADGFQRQLPDPAVVIENHARPRMAEWRYLFQDQLDVPQIVNEIGEDDVIKLLIQRDLMDIAGQDGELGMAGARGRDHARREIDTEAKRRRESSEQIPSPATQLEKASP